jgi:hypothetical protein
MNDILNACLPALKATLLRRVDSGALGPVCSGVVLVLGIGSAPVTVNGQEVRPQHEGSHLLGAIFCARHAFDWTGHQPLAPGVGDVICLRGGDGNPVGYEVRVAGPGSDPRAKGTLEYDAFLAELRHDLGPLEIPSAALHPVHSTLLH